MADVTLTLGVNTRAAEAAIDRLSRRRVNLGGVNSRNFTVPLGRIQGQLGEFNKSLMASNARVLAFGASAFAIMAVSRGFTELVKSTLNVEKKLAEINVVLGTSQSRLKSFGNELFNAAANAGMGFDAAAEAATEFSRQGLGLEKTLKRVNDALILSRLTGLQVADSVNAITAAINGYNLTLKEQENLVSRIIAVDQAFAVSGADIAEAMRRVASTAKGAGVSLNELIAIVTAAQQKTARGGAVIGNSFKTIFTRLQRPKTLEALEAVGIATRDATGAMLPAMQVMKNLAKRYDNLTHAQKSNIAQLVGGVFQINVLKAAIGDLSKQFSIYGNALEIANGATSEAEDRNAELNKTLSAQFNKALQGVTKLAAAIGDLAIAPALTKIVSGLNAVFSDPKESKGWGTKLASGLLDGFGAFLSGPGLLMVGVGLFKLFQFLGKQARDAAVTITKMGKTTEHRAALQDRIMTQLQNEPALLQKILRGEKNIDAVHDSILKDIKAENDLLRSQEAIAKRIVTALSKKTTLTGGGSPMIRPRAEGYIPNHALSPLERERRNAMALGASSRVQGYYDKDVRIKGRKGAIVNTEEDVLHNYARGETAVIPRYPGGFMPVPPVFSKTGRPPIGKHHLDKPTGEFGFGTISAEGVGVISASGSKRTMLTLSPSVLKKNTNLTKATKGVNVTGIDHYGPAPGGNVLNRDSGFRRIIEKPLGDAILKISKKLLGKTPKEIPDPEQVGRLVAQDKSAYPQMAGRIFEKALSAALIPPSADRNRAGNETWDFKKGDFEPRKSALKSMLGGTQAESVLRQNFIDSKLNINSDAYKFSMAKKLSNTPGVKTALAKQSGHTDAVRQAGKKGKAGGYIPNFASNMASELGKSIGREHEAGIPYSQMRIHTDENGIPFAVTNKKDEPNGLRDVAAGYIPNFAGGLGGAGGFLTQLKERTFVTYSEISAKHQEASAKIVNADSAVIAARQKEQTEIQKNERALNKQITAEEKAVKAKNKAIRMVDRYGSSHTKSVRAVQKLIQARAKLDQANAKVTASTTRLTAATTARATAETTAGAASSKKGAGAAKMEKMAGGAMMASFAAPMLAGGMASLTGAGENATKSLTDAASAIGMGAMVFSMFPGPAGGAIGALIAVTGAFHALFKYLGTKGLEKFQKAAEKGKEDLESFNASSQSLSSALDGLQSEYAKMKPDAAKIISLQKQYAAALGELPPSIRAQVLSAGSLAEVQENLAKAQKQMVDAQKQRELGAKLAKGQSGAVGIGNQYGAGRAMETTSDGSGSGLSGGAAMGSMGGGILAGAAIGAAVGSFIPVIGTAVGAAVGAAVGGLASLSMSISTQMRANEGMADAEVFGGGEDSVSLGNFTKDFAKSMDFAALSADVASGQMNIMGMSQNDLANKLRNTYGAGKEVTAMLKQLGMGDMQAFRGELMLLSIQAGNAKREMEALNKIFQKNARIQQAISQVMQRQSAAIKTMLAALNTQIEGRRAEGQTRLQGQRDVARKRFDSETKLMDPFMTEEAKAIRDTKGKKFDVEEKRLGGFKKAQDKGRADIMKAAMAAAGDDPAKQAKIRQAQEGNIGKSNVELLTALNGINVNGQNLLQNNQAFQAEASSAQAQQNTSMRQADIKAQTQIDILNMQLQLQKKQIQIQKDIKVMGGMGAFMDPEGEGKKKAEDFEKGLGAYSKGGVRGDKMQQGRGAVQLLRSAMDAGVNIMGPGAEGMKEQAIEGNAAFLKQTFTDRATRLRTTAGEMRAAGDAGGAAKLEEQARGYDVQAGRAKEIAGNQVYAEFKKSQMPENISAMLTAEQELVRLQADSLATRQTDFQNAIQASGVTARLNALQNAITQQTAMQVQMDAAKDKSKAEAKLEKAKQEKESATNIINAGDARAGLGTAAFSDAEDKSSGTDDTGALQKIGSAMGFSKKKGMSGAMDELIKSMVAGSDGKIQTMADLKSYDNTELERIFKAGVKKRTDAGETGVMTESKIDDAGVNFDNMIDELFGDSGDYLTAMLQSQNKATQQYVTRMNEYITALNTQDTADAEIQSLAAASRAADTAFQQATNSVNAMNSALVASQNEIANQMEEGDLKGEKQNVEKKRDSDVAKLEADKQKLVEQTADPAKIAAKQAEIDKVKADAAAKVADLDAKIAKAQAGQGESSVKPNAAAGLPAGPQPVMLPTANTNVGNAVPQPRQGTGYAAGPGDLPLDPVTGQPLPATGGRPTTMNSIARPQSGGEGWGGGGGGLGIQGQPGPIPGPGSEGEGTPLGDLASNVGNLVNQLSEGTLSVAQNINFDSPLPLQITVGGQMTTLISPEQQAQIEQAVINRLQGANALTPGQATSASGLPA